MMKTALSDSLFAELNLDKLPSLPQILLRLLDLCQDHTSSFKHIADLVSQDTAISARVISLANSSYYGQTGKVDTIERALMLLGTDTIKTIVITVVVQQFFSGISTQQSHFLHRFWRHSLTSALLAKAIAQLTSYKTPDEAYLIGLIHNIGELILRVNHPSSFEDTSDETRSPTEQETEQFGFTHAELGGWLVRQWGLDFAADAIAYHHDTLPRLLDAHHLSKIIYLASLLANPAASDSAEAYDAGHQLFGLTAALVREITLQIRAQVDTAAAQLNITLDQPANMQAANISLAERIRDLSLMQTAQSHLLSADDLDHFYRVLQQSVELLFGYRHCVLLCVNDATHCLEYKPSANDNEATLKIRLESQRSWIADCALNQKVDFSQHTQSNLAAIDEQVTRLTHSEASICVPLHDDTQLKGVLILGCSADDRLTDKRQALLALFGSQIAKQLSQIANDEARTSSERRFFFNRLQLKVREIVHEVNNPLSIMRNYLKVLTNKLEDSPNIHKELGIIREEIDRAGQLLLQLKDLGVEKDEDQNVTDINHEIQQLCDLYNESLFVSHNIDCHVTLDKKLKPQKLNRNRLRQVLTNLLKNACEAMEQGGEITVSTLASVNINGKTFCEIKINDNGPGLPEEVKAQLFSPLTSTKEGNHSGLGLSITRNLVTGLQGNISCRSSENGTEFQLHFPLNNTNT